MEGYGGPAQPSPTMGQCLKVVTPEGRSLSSLELPLSPMAVFALGIEHPLYMTVQARMTAIRANIVGPLRDTSNSACIATCQSDKSVSFFGSALIYSPASISVTSNQPSASVIGSSNLRCQPVSATGCFPSGEQS